MPYHFLSFYRQTGKELLGWGFTEITVVNSSQQHHRQRMFFKRWTFWRSFKSSVPLSLESKVSAFQWMDESDSPGEIRRWSLDSKWVVPQEKASNGLSSVHCNSHTSWYHTGSKSRLKRPTQEGRGTPRTYSKISDTEIMFFLLCFSNRKNSHDSKAEV